MGCKFTLPEANEKLEEKRFIYSAPDLVGYVKVDIISGTLMIVPTCDFEYSCGLSGITTAGRIDAKVVVDLQVKCEVSCAVQAGFKYMLLPELTKTIIIPATPTSPPIILDLVLSIPASVDISASGSASATFDHHSEYVFSANMDYSSLNGFTCEPDKDKIISESTIVGDPDSFKATISTKAYLEPTVKVKLYKMVGPYVWLQPYLKVEVVVPLEKNRDDIFFGLCGGVGLELGNKLFGTFDLKSEPLFDVYKSWDVIGDKDAGGDNTAPVAYSLDFTVSRNSITQSNLGTMLQLKATDGENDSLQYEIVNKASYPNFPHCVL